MKNWLRTALFVSSVSPVFFSLAYLRYDSNGLDRQFYQLIAFGVCGSLLTWAILLFAKKNRPKTTIKLKKLEPNDFMFIVLIFGYLVPFFNKVSSWSFNEIAMLVAAIFLIAMCTNQVPAHPLLTIFGYRFYKAEAESGIVYVLISKREISDLKQMLIVQKISESMLIES